MSITVKLPMSSFLISCIVAIFGGCMNYVTDITEIACNWPKAASIAIGLKEDGIKTVIITSKNDDSNFKTACSANLFLVES